MGVEAVARLSKIVLFLLLSICPMMGTAQERRPFIELFRSLYLTSGLPLTEKPTKENVNVNVEAARRIGRRNNNPYLFVQFHYGYDEALRDWLKDSNGPLAPRAMLRFGLLLTPHNFMRGCL